MNQHHELGFKQLAERGLRHVTAWHGHWVALASWQGRLARPGANAVTHGWAGP